MVVDIVAITSIALSGTAMLMQTLFTSRCTHISCCGDEGCISCERNVDETKKDNKQTINKIPTPKSTI